MSSHSRIHLWDYRYPEDKITILTTYNGQKALIRDVLNQRCSWNPLFGRPAKVTTVDKFQGQQNDCNYYESIKLNFMISKYTKFKYNSSVSKEIFLINK